MAELREVFEMTTKQVEPDLDSWKDQERRQEQRRRRRRLGAFAVAAAIGVAAVALVLVSNQSQDASTAADEVPTIAPPATSSEAFLLDLRTGDMTPLPKELRGGDDYRVSPDGTMFAYTRSTPSARLYVADVDGAGVHEVPTGGLEPNGPSWSPDGSLLVYQGLARDPNVGDLFVVDLTTDEVRRITDLEPRTAWWWYRPSFAPDGETILFHFPRPSDAGTRWDLWSVPVAGGEPTLVRRDAAEGVYAPDGRTLAYLDAPRVEDDEGWSSSLWLADTDGSDPRLLVDGDFFSIRWSPDGTKIAFSGGGEIRVVDIATGEFSHVADGANADWLDDDTLVVSPAE
jgi:Tol biopolymer transport system component